MSKQHIEATPEGLRRAAHLFADVSARTGGLLTDVRTDLAAPGEPWGHDESGTKFAEGDGDPEKGYLVGRDSVLASVENLIRTFDDNARNLLDGGNRLESADSGAGRMFR
ncbi:WXG100 family type VII secretion target [Nocardia takedensis]